LFRFETLRWIDAAEEDEGVLGDGYWTCDHFSGLYQTAVAAEQDARRIIPWLRTLEGTWRLEAPTAPDHRT
jgi:hypothetical protein